MTSAVEDYLKAIYNLAYPADGAVHPVTTSALAQRLGVAAPSVSAMLARLDQAGLTMRRSRTVELTALGEAAALKIVRRHRLVETLLHQNLGVPWDEIHEEAERLEHAISDRLEGYLDRALGYPTHDPHGDPIPGTHPTVGPDGPYLALADAPPEHAFLVRRISDTDPAALRHLAEHGVMPRTVLTVLRHDPFGGPTWLHVPGRDGSHPLAAQLARDVFGDLVQTSNANPEPIQQQLSAPEKWA